MVLYPMTYKQLNDILSKLGFTRERVREKWLLYEHADSDTMIVLIEKKPNERVRPSDAISARRHLVEKGIISEEEIEALLTRKTKG
jgi:predicted RNA binding protein YcfA (HicA-like mRNA interferase family)